MQNLNAFAFSCFGNSSLCEVLYWAVASLSPGRTQWVHISLAVKGLASPSAQPLDISHLDLVSGTVRQRHRAMTTHLWWSSLKWRRLRFWDPESFWNLWPCFDMHPFPSFHPPVHSPFWEARIKWILFFSVFSDFFFFLAGGGGVFKRARGSYFHLQPTVFTGTQWMRTKVVQLPWKVVGKSALGKWSINSIQEEVLLFPEYECWQLDIFDQKKEVGRPEEIHYPAPNDPGNYQ